MTPPEPPPTPSLQHVLLVEDMLVNRRVAVAFLEKRHYRVTQAETGLAAVQIARDTDFDLILLDIRLPDIDGIEVARRIRALSDPKRAQTPILALTANVFSEDVESYRRVGMNGVIGKPIEEEQFLHAVHSVTQQASPQATPSVIKSHSKGHGVIELWDRHQTIDEDFIAERLLTLGESSFKTILLLGRRSTATAVEETLRAYEELLQSPTDTTAQEKLRKTAHKLAGAASNFGFAGLYTVGLEAELALERGEQDTAVNLLASLEQLHQQTVQALDQWLLERRLSS